MQGFTNMHQLYPQNALESSILYAQDLAKWTVSICYLLTIVKAVK